MRRAVPLAIVAAWLAAASPASADEARRHFERGDEHYREGRYQEAIAELEAAYELSGLPALLFNIAQAHRLAGDLEEATRYYEEFLARAPDHPLAPEAHEKLELVRPKPAAAQPGPGAVALGRAEPQRRRAAVPPLPELPDHRGQDLRLAGLIVAGAGAAALAAGGYYGWRARALGGELSSHDGAWTAELLAKQEAGRAAQRRMLIASGTGAIAIAAGIGLHLYGRKLDRAGAGAGIAVRGAPDGFLVTLDGTWR